MNKFQLIGAVALACGAMSAQPQNATGMPIYRVSVTSGTVKAISYQHRSGSTKIDFRGTNLLPGARGEARVESKQGHIEIEADFEGLQGATKNGAEYLTYVMWAITPEGRTVNLGEVLLNGTKSKLAVSTDLQVFGLVVTAEPYYAVTRPSNLIVMENIVRADTVGKTEEMDAKYELLERGDYQRLANPLSLKPDKKLPLELYEGRNAVQIARAMGADRYATETFKKAEASLAQAEAYQKRNAGRKPVAMTAREAVQMAEDARNIAVKRQEDDVAAAERQGLVDRSQRAENGQAAAQSETDRVTREAEASRIRAQAETDRLRTEKNAQAANAAMEASRMQQANEARTAAAAVEAARLQSENDAKLAAATAETARLKQGSDAQMAANAAEVDRLKTENDARMAAATAEAARVKQGSDAQMAAKAAEADRLKTENDNRMAAAGAEAERLKRDNQANLDNAAKLTAQAQAEKTELRLQLLRQFNAILQTRDTVRGLVVNMSDVLFDTGKFTLRPAAREKLAKIAGIVSGHPGLRLDVEGYTDSVGGDDYNQKLSEQRGGSVRTYLTAQGMSESSVTSKGFGKGSPVASNDTPAGRQENRRVEIVISGEVIGTTIGTVVIAK